MDKKRRSSQAADELYAQWTQELEQVGIPNQSLEKLRAIWAKNCQVQAEFFEATVGEEEEATVEQDEESTTTLGVNEQEEEEEDTGARTTIVLDDEENNATMVAWSGLDEAMVRGEAAEEDEVAIMRAVVYPKDTVATVENEQQEDSSVANETTTVQTRYSSAQIEEAYTRLLSIWDAEDEHAIGADAQGMRKSLLAMQKKCAKRREVEQEESEQVIQPIHVSAHGTVKFVQNQIVADMVQMVSFGDIVTKFERGQYKEHEYFQLLQLLGWPISLFQQLSCVRQNPTYLAKVLAKAEAVCQN